MSQKCAGGTKYINHCHSKLPPKISKQQANHRCSYEEVRKHKDEDIILIEDIILSVTPARLFIRVQMRLGKKSSNRRAGVTRLRQCDLWSLQPARSPSSEQHANVISAWRGCALWLSNQFQYNTTSSLLPGAYTHAHTLRKEPFIVSRQAQSHYSHLPTSKKFKGYHSWLLVHIVSAGLFM